MAFSGEGAAGGAASGAAMGTAVLPGWGTAIGGVVGGLAGGFMGAKKKKKIDITQQLNELHANALKNQGINNELLGTTTANLGQFKFGSQEAIDKARTDFTGAKGEYLGATNDLTEQTKAALRKNLYADTFTGMPDQLQAIREASAAGGGLDTGSYQKTLNDFGRTTAQNLARGETDIQVAGLENMQAAQTNVFNTFNQLSQKLTDSQLDVLTKVLDTGDANAVRQATVQMGLNDAETQGVIDLLNFKQSGELAQSTASDANKNSLLAALIGAGGNIAGQYVAKGKKTTAPTPK